MKKFMVGLILSLSLLSTAHAADYTIQITPTNNSIGDNQVSSISSSKISDFASSVISSISSLLSSYLIRSEIPTCTGNSFLQKESNGSFACVSLNSVEVKYTISANERTITMGGGVIPFGHKVLDNLDAYNPSTGEFTAPMDGLYLVAANLFTSSNLNSSTSWFFSALKTNASGIVLEIIAFDNKAGTGAPNTNNAVKITGIVRMVSGEKIRLESSLDTNVSLPINQNYNQLSIVKISN